MHPACLELDAFERECRFRFSRASGPGGQHRNKVETCVTVEHLPSGCQASASEARQQGENRSAALQRLRCAVAVQVRSQSAQEIGDATELRPIPEPSPVWKSYCRSGKIRVAPGNEHYPAILAEALDVLAAAEWDLTRAAAGLTTSASQLVRLLATYPPALQELNRQRAERGLAPRAP